METYVFDESDWKLFRGRLPEWQEAYMDRLNREYASLLAGPGTAAETFWTLEKRINTDKHSVGVSARMSRSNMYHNIMSLIYDGVITMDDMKGFSDDLQAKVAFVMGASKA